MNLYSWTPNAGKQIISDQSYICNSEGLIDCYSVQYNSPPNMENFAINACYNHQYDKFFNNNKSMLDIGACYGVYSIEFLKAGLVSHSYAFEPNKVFYSQLNINAVLNNVYDKLTSFNNFVSDKSKPVMYNGWMSLENSDFCYPDVLSSNVYERLYDNDLQYKEITAISIDDLSLTNIGFIKIDTEGHELEVIRGAIKTIINNNFPPILFEMWSEDADLYFTNKTEEQHNALHEHNMKLISGLELLGYKIQYDVNNDKITHLAYHE